MRNAPVTFAVLLLAAVGVLTASMSSRALGASLEGGKAIYEESCAKCHGTAGAGDGRAGRSLEHKPTAFNVTSKLAPDDKLFKATREGGKAVGQSGDMEGFPKLSDEQIRDVIAYVKTLAK